MTVLRAALAAVLAVTAIAARAESPRWGSFDVSGGTYRPDIDSEFSTRPGDYEKIFGKGKGGMFRVGVAKSLFTGVGSLDVGLSAGYFRQTGKAQSVDASGNPLGPSGDPTTFEMIPTSAFLTYRLDWLAEHYPIPLAPYARVALERYNWWVTGASGNSVKVGATNGWSAAAGLALLLDLFDRDLARELDADTGINHTYLFFEAQKSKVNDFGSSKSWNLSDPKLSFSGGLLMVF